MTVGDPGHGTLIGLFWFLSQRGTAGRTPSVWDVNLRAAYEIGLRRGATGSARLVLDLLHLASQREAVDYDQQKYFEVDENGDPVPGTENPMYMHATRWQPPMTVRLGLEIGL